MSLAFARPIVGVIQGDGRTVISEAGGGFLADENSDSLKDALIAVSNLTEKEKAHFGELNRRYYQEHFSTEKVCSLIEREFRN